MGRQLRMRHLSSAVLSGPCSSCLNTSLSRLRLIIFYKNEDHQSDVSVIGLVVFYYVGYVCFQHHFSMKFMIHVREVPCWPQKQRFMICLQPVADIGLRRLTDVEETSR